MKMSRAFGRANKDTFSCPPIKEFVQRYLVEAVISVDPFARNKPWFTYTNDLNPETSAQFHMDAEAFLFHLDDLAVRADLGIVDPPYSPRQISESYKGFGKTVTKEDTQNARLYKRVRDAMDNLIPVGGIVLSFGWNSNGMGKGRNYEIVEVLLVGHGSAHNDTICMAERKLK
jgi:hypothetical protein